MNCPKCHKEISDTFSFCGHCGERLTAPQRDERRDVTILFADMQGFTSMSEQLDAEEVQELMNRCFAGTEPERKKGAGAGQTARPRARGTGCPGKGRTHGTPGRPEKGTRPDPKALRAMIEMGLARVAERLAETAPNLCALLDSYEWADDESARLLEGVVGNQSDASLIQFIS